MSKPVYLFVLAVVLGSCAIKTTTNLDFSISPKNSKEVIKQVNSKNKHPEWLSLKGSANIVQKDQDFTVSLNIKIRKDSIIWISARGPFGIELIRAQLTLDSIYFINRTNKTYLREPAEDIMRVLKSDLSFSELQDMITANPKILEKNYKLDVNPMGFYLVSDDISYFITNNYRVQNIKKINYKGSFESDYEVGYLYKEFDSFPKKLSLKIFTEKTFEITINYSKVEFNKPQKILFEIPKLYNEDK